MSVDDASADPPLGSRLGRARTQAVLGVVDQALSSATNFGAVLIAAVALSPADFGAFSVAYVCYTILVAGTQAVLGNELVLIKGDRGTKLARGREALAFALVLGALSALCLAAAAVAIPGVRGVLLALAAPLPVLFVQDTARFVAATVQRSEVAVLSDLCWLVLMVVTAGVLRSSGATDDPSQLVLCWALPGVVAGLVVLPAFGRTRPLPSLRRFWTRSYLGYRFVGEFLVLRALSQGLTVVLGGLAGLAATGSLRAALTLFGPLTVAMLAASSFGAPVVQRAPRSHRDRLLLLIGTACVTLTALLYALLRLIPADVGRRVLGSSWEGATPMLLPVAVQVACTAVSTVAYLALRMVAPRTTLPLRLWSAVAVLPAFFGGYLLGGVVGAAWGLTAGSVAQAGLGVACYRRLRSRGRGLSAAEA